MKVLLDECVPQDLCKHFSEHNCHAARRAGFGGKTNGELLTLAEQAGFAVLITVDQGIAYQQQLTHRTIGLVVIHARSNRIEALLPHVPACLEALRSIRPGEVVRVED